MRHNESYKGLELLQGNKGHKSWHCSVSICSPSCEKLEEHSRSVARRTVAGTGRAVAQNDLAQIASFSAKILRTMRLEVYAILALFDPGRGDLESAEVTRHISSVPTVALSVPTSYIEA